MHHMCKKEMSGRFDDLKQTGDSHGLNGKVIRIADFRVQRPKVDR